MPRKDSSCFMSSLATYFTSYRFNGTYGQILHGYLRS